MCVLATACHQSIAVETSNDKTFGDTLGIAGEESIPVSVRRMENTNQSHKS